jgi:hypothetical protein
MVHIRAICAGGLAAWSFEFDTASNSCSRSSAHQAALGQTLGFALGQTLGFALGQTLGFALGQTLGL